MAVEAARDALSGRAGAECDLYLATTSPAYLDKTNASTVHTALGLEGRGFAADLAGSARSGVAALRAAANGGGLAVVSDVRTGLPGSQDESNGGDGAAAFLFGDGAQPIAHVITFASETVEALDRWRTPHDSFAQTWEERFGYEVYAPLIARVARRALDNAGIRAADHVRVVSPNSAIRKKAASLISGASTTAGSPIGHSGAADIGLALADALDAAQPDQTILVISAADGCDALVVHTTDALTERRQRVALADRLTSGMPVPYTTYLSWRGFLERELPRRPEPDRPAAPPSARADQWKFAFVGSRCTACGFVHLPPSRACRRCRSIDTMIAAPLAHAKGTIATFTIDRLAYSASPPLMEAVIDFADGGRYTLEVADTDPEQLRVGLDVEVVFRRLFTAGGVHNYFWKARPIPVPGVTDGQ